MRVAPVLAFALSSSLGCSPEVPLGDGADAGKDAPGGTGGTGGDGSSGVGGTGGGAGNAGATAGDCSIVSTGDLPPPITPTAFITGPGVVATDSGFVLGYREQSFATSRARLVSLSDTGELGPPAQADLGGCAAKVPSDGVGMAFADGFGMFATSLPDCGNGAGAVFVPFDQDGKPGNSSGPHNSAFKDISVAQGGALAPTATSNEFEFLYRVVTQSGVIERVVLQGAAFKNLPISHPFGEGDGPFGLVATNHTNGDVRAFVGATPTEVQVLVGRAATDTIDTLGTFALPLAPWATVSAWDNRVAAAVPVATGLSLAAAEINATNQLETLLAPTLLANTGTKSAALARLGNRLIVVAGSDQRLSIWSISGATATLTVPTSPAEFTGVIAGHSLTSFDGTSVAVAAARDRLVIVWRSKHGLAAGDPTGGYVVLACPN